MKSLRALLLLTIIMLIAAVAYVLLVPDALGFLESTKTITDEETINKTAIAFVSVPYKDDYGTTRLPGYVDNQTPKEIRALTLEIQLTDSEGNKQENITHELVRVRPSSRKTFDINIGTVVEDFTPSIRVTSVKVVE